MNGTFIQISLYIRTIGDDRADNELDGDRQIWKAE